jgi:hypothetical protein
MSPPVDRSDDRIGAVAHRVIELFVFLRDFAVTGDVPRFALILHRVPRDAMGFEVTGSRGGMINPGGPPPADELRVQTFGRDTYSISW